MSNPAMSPQQRRFSASDGGQLQKYKELVVGDDSWAKFFAFESYNLLFANIPSFVGLGIRTYTLPLFFKSAGKGLVVGRGASIRCPSQISVGNGVLIDEYASLDVRMSEANNSTTGIELGNHVLLGRHSSIVSKNAHIKIGNASNISSHCRIASESRIEIGESVLIAAYAYIGPGNHRFEDSTAPIISQGMEHKGGVKIGDNCWIGARATIVDGVTIGKDAIVGAHSLVLEDVPERAIVVGSPAKVVRLRD